MPKPPEHPLKQTVIAEIKRHLATVGSNNWNVIIDQFPEVPPASMWRWIKQAKESDVPRPELINAKAKVIQRVKGAINDRTVEARQNGTERIARHIPAAPAPSYIARSGEAGLQNLDVVAEIHELYRDAKMLRTFSIKKVEDGTEAIKNPVAFEKSINTRNRILQTAIQTTSEIWDLRMMQNFYDTIIDEIGKESPECQRRIMERLAELNGRQGFTTSMRV